MTLTGGNINRALRIAPSYSVSAGLVVSAGTRTLACQHPPHDHYLPFQHVIVVDQTGAEPVHRVLLQLWASASVDRAMGRTEQSRPKKPTQQLLAEHQARMTRLR